MQTINVGMSQIEVSKDPKVVLVAPSLGSCIGLAVYDPINKVAGMAHVVLPDSSSINKPVEQPGKYANLAVPELLKRVENLGAKKQNLIVKLVGGAQMFNLQKGSNILNIGVRNTVSVNAELSKLGVKVVKSDTGGNKGRTFKVYVVDGKFKLKVIGSDEVDF